MRRLLVVPDQTSYQLSPSSGAAAADYEGGAMAIRPDYRGAPIPVQVQWTLEAAQFDYLMAFYRLATVAGSLPFLMLLPTDHAEFEAVKARITPGSLALSAKRGNSFLVRAQLEVVPLKPDRVADAALVAGYAP